MTSINRVSAPFWNRFQDGPEAASEKAAIKDSRTGTASRGVRALATIAEVAKKAGVSKSTVSRVLNGVAVSEETRVRVKAVVNQLNFKPNAQARGLSLRRNNLIGVFVPGIARQFHGEILEGIDSSLADAGFGMVVCSMYEQADHEAVLNNLLLGKRVDGLIIVTPLRILAG